MLCWLTLQQAGSDIGPREMDGIRHSPDNILRAEALAVIEGLGPVADQLGTRGAVAQYEADIGDPARTRAGTSFSAHSGPLPRFVPVRDIVRISFNILELQPADAILRRLTRSTRLPVDDNLTTTLPYAPTLAAALEFATRYNNVMVPWFHWSLETVENRLRSGLRPLCSLGQLGPVSAALSLISAHRILETFVGVRVAEAELCFVDPPVEDAFALEVPLSVIQGETLLLREAPSRTRETTLHLLSCAGIEPLETIELHTRETIREAIAIGVGVSTFYSAECPPDPRVNYLPLGCEVPIQTGYVMCLADNRRTPLARSVFETAATLTSDSPIAL